MDCANDDLILDQAADLSTKTKAVQRGARACTTCRNAKMKCIATDDPEGKCQRCRRAGADCVFEKHKRGRKPGSKLSEASRMLRKLEKGLHNQRRNATIATDEGGKLGSSSDLGQSIYDGSSNTDLKVEEEEEAENERTPHGMFPAKLIEKENRRNSFFSTILNPSQSNHASPPCDRPLSTVSSSHSHTVSSAPACNAPMDPVDSGILTWEVADILIETMFIRLNPFINLFDPALHNTKYFRRKSPFLFTVLLMVASKFAKCEYYPALKKAAKEMTVNAFADDIKSVEVCQAFACLTYWKEADENRTWTYIGYACRMAVELGLYKYVNPPPPGETDIQFLERRNRERTFLVLFVHDRSLAIATGRLSMLPICDLVTRVGVWHETPGHAVRQEDVIVAAFVDLRRNSSVSMDLYFSDLSAPSDQQFDMMVSEVNERVTRWTENWTHQLCRAEPNDFSRSFILLFRAYDKLFLNSFGYLRAQESSLSANCMAFNECWLSAIDILDIVVRNFKTFGVLRYGQDSILVMTAYAALFLLRLLRSPHGRMSFQPQQVYGPIEAAADAYEESNPSPNTAASNHAGFLRMLVLSDRNKHGSPDLLDPRMPPNPQSAFMAPPTYVPNRSSTPQMPPAYMQSQSMPQYNMHTQQSNYLPPSNGSQVPNQQSYPISPVSATPPMDSTYPAAQRYASMPGPSQPNGMYGQSMIGTEHGKLDDLDGTVYWNSMFRNLGFGSGDADNIRAPPLPLAATADDGNAIQRAIPPYPAQLLGAHGAQAHMMAALPPMSSGYPTTQQQYGRGISQHQQHQASVPRQQDGHGRHSSASMQSTTPPMQQQQQYQHQHHQQQQQQQQQHHQQHGAYRMPSHMQYDHPSTIMHSHHHGYGP